MQNKCVVYILLTLLIFTNCSKFDEKNINQNVFYHDEVSAKYFLTDPQYKLYAPDRFPYWRAHLIHADRYAGHFCFGHNASWWHDELAYTYSSGYTDATWDWLAGYYGGLDNFIKMTMPEGEFANQYMYAMSLIMKGLYYQIFTDIFGMIPYSEAGNINITLPKFDSQNEIYYGIINDLDLAISLIGDETKTGLEVEDATSNDIYFEGDLQKWKKMANTLKLRLAIRAYSLPNVDFAEDAIKEALQMPLLETKDDNCLMVKDTKISQWTSAAYGDIWHNFSEGSDWTLNKVLIDYLRENNDPRLYKYATPSEGGEIKLIRPKGPEASRFEKRANFILQLLDEVNANYTKKSVTDTITIYLPEDEYYIGQPGRLNEKMKSYANYNLFCTPSEKVIAKKNSGNDIFPEIVLTTAEAYFLRAEAAIHGLSNETPEEMYQEGIRQAMLIWEVPDFEIDNYLDQSPMAQLVGSMEEKIEKIAIQKWILSYTDGFEAWTVVRKYGYPKELADGVSDPEIFGFGDINGKYPQRMRYGNATLNKNGKNTSDAIALQGPDQQDTKLWWAKK